VRKRLSQSANTGNGQGTRRGWLAGESKRTGLVGSRHQVPLRVLRQPWLRRGHQINMLRAHSCGQQRGPCPRTCVLGFSPVNLVVGPVVLRSTTHAWQPVSCTVQEKSTKEWPGEGRQEA
jgi:hypothetical protein